jgi:DNA polymerase elongation subunit (family B)
LTTSHAKSPLSVQVNDKNIFVIANRKIYEDIIPIDFMVEYSGIPRWMKHGRPQSWTSPATGENRDVYISKHSSVDSVMKASMSFAVTDKDGNILQKHALDPLEQIYVRAPGYYMKYPQTDDPVNLFIDIEVGSDGGALFPRPERCPVVMIGYAIDENPVEIMTVKDMSEEDMLAKWIDVVANADPDFIASYNGRRFDLPFINERCRIHGIDTSPLRRLPFQSYKMESNAYKAEDEPYDDTYLGRVEFDVFWDGVRLDMSDIVMGIPNRKMKTVAGAYGVDIGEELSDSEVRNITAMLETPSGVDKAIRYLESDVSITRSLFKIYYPTKEALAELMGVPMDALTQTYKSFVPKLMHARHFYDNNYTAFDRNTDKYSGRDATMCSLGNMRSEDRGARYQGAFVDIVRTGRASPVWKADMSSYYPSMMRTLHLSPDTTVAAATREYTGETKFTREGDYLYILVPDKVLGVQVIMKINMKKKGFLTGEIERLQNLRLSVKASLSGLDESTREYKRLKSTDNALKVILNSIYGMEGESTTEYGDLPIAMTTTAICRWLMAEHVNKWLIPDSILEIDTDGYYVDKEPDIERVNENISNLFKDLIGEPGCIKMDIDGPWDAGCFYKKKVYVLKKKDRISLHGQSFKNSGHCPGLRKFIEHTAKLQLDNAPRSAYMDAMRTCGDPRTWNIDDYVCSFTFRRDPYEYGSWSNIATKLSEQISFLEKKQPKEDDMVEFLHTASEWTLTTENAPSTMSSSKLCVTILPLYDEKQGVNIAKYSNMVTKALSRFSIEIDDIAKPSVIDIIKGRKK